MDCESPCRTSFSRASSAGATGVPNDHAENMKAISNHIANMQKLAEKRNMHEARSETACDRDNPNWAPGVAACAYERPIANDESHVASVEGGMQTPKSRWMCAGLLFDSGAVWDVGNPKSFPEYSVRQSEGATRGLHYIVANQGKIRHEGEQHLSCFSYEGPPAQLCIQSASVPRAILSVSKLVEHGKNGVSFRLDGGTIRDTRSGLDTEFHRKHGVFVLRIWLRAGPNDGAQLAAGVAWQG